MTHQQGSRARLRTTRRHARTIRNGLILGIGLVLITLAVLISGAGETFWPMWLVQARAAIVGLLTVVAISLTLLAPVMIAFYQDPRPLSGPGINPEMRQ